MVIMFSSDYTELVDTAIYDRFTYNNPAYWFYNSEQTCGTGLQLYVHPDESPVDISSDIDLDICYHYVKYTHKYDDRAIKLI